MKNKINLIIGITVAVALLSVIIVSGEIIWSSDTGTYFSLADNYPMCESGGLEWATYDNLGERSVELTADDCYRADGHDTLGDRTTCCPSGSVCTNPGNGGDWTCEPVRIRIDYCWEYNATTLGSLEAAEEACNEDTYQAKGNESVELWWNKPSGFCGSSRSYVNTLGQQCDYTYYNCRCEWDDDEDICISTWSTAGGCSGNPSTEIFGECKLNANIEGDCSVDDYYSIRWVAKFVNVLTNQIITDPTVQGYDECQNSVKQYPCINLARLTFFTIGTLIGAIVVIVIVYLLLRKKKPVKEKQKVQKKTKKNSKKRK